MEIKVTFQTSKGNVRLLVNERPYGSFNAIPAYLREAMTKEQVRDILTFFGQDTERDDVTKIFGEKKEET